MVEALFGTDGIRGRAFEPPLDEDTVRRLGATVAEALSSDGGNHVLLAGDTRASTEVLARWFSGAFLAGGGRVTWGGVLPTPAVSQLVRRGSFDAGVVISASHNPAHDNGIKILRRSGEKIADETERRLEQRLPAVPLLPGDRLPQADGSLAETYLRIIEDSLGAERPLDAMKIVVDAAHGAASGFAEALLQRLGAEVTAIASDPDGSNINDDCGATAPEALSRSVLAAGADAGVALDGDADRCILVDEKGAVMDGDDILLAWARQLLADGQLEGPHIVATVMSNFGLERALNTDGITLIRCPVGDRWVWEAMTESGAVLGGEQSGHVICSLFGVSGDGLLTASHVMSAAARRGIAVSELSNLHRLPQVLLNVPVASKPPLGELPQVRRGLEQTERRLAGRGRVLLRYSGTEPLARVMIEGDDDDEITRLAEDLADAIRREIGRQ